MLADCRDKLSPEQRRCITKADNLEAANSCTETAATVGHKLLDTYVEVLNLYMLLDGTSDREQARQKYLPQ